MNAIDNRLIFSDIQELSTNSFSQVILCNYRLPGRRLLTVSQCVLKIFTQRFVARFDREVEIYAELAAANTSLQYPAPLGSSQWSLDKYKKVLGRLASSEIENSGDSDVFVFMLEYVDAPNLSTIELTPEIAKACILELKKLHKLGIVHGDVSADNILYLKTEASFKVVWLDFASSWTSASSGMLAAESKRAALYFARMVMNANNMFSNLIGQHT
jgi:RIO-like serine/threonine protein kinase